MSFSAPRTPGASAGKARSPRCCRRGRADRRPEGRGAVATKPGRAPRVSPGRHRRAGPPEHARHTRTTAAGLIVAALRAEKITAAFGLVGTHIVEIYDALRRAPEIRAL